MKDHTHPFLTLLAVTALAVSLPFAIAAPFGDDGEPKAANKTSASASSLQLLSADLMDIEGGVTILESLIKTSKPQDLILSVSLECALWTKVVSTTIDDHPEGYTAYGRAEAYVDVWLEIDGVRVAIDGDDTPAAFCSRVHEQEITDIDEDTGNFTISQYLETKTANAFNWFALDLGSGVHHIAVKADVRAENTEGGFAEGGIGKRTLVVEPTRFANGA